jgi:hypothetical protein
LKVLYSDQTDSGGRAAATAACIVAVPLLPPVAGMIFSVIYARLLDEPMRWN